MSQRTRNRILRVVRKDAPTHRYHLWRTVGQTFSLGVLLLVPLAGLVRIDLWRGEHRLLFADAAFRPTLAVLLAVFAGIYTVTFLANVVAGRMFCGWGCPVGQLSRFGEAVDEPGLAAGRRLGAHLRGAAFGFALALSGLAWWTDLRVLVQGSPAAAGTAWGILVSLSALAWAHGRGWRWAFCRTTCPIGLYYSFVAPASWYGVTFPNLQERCLECNVCDNVCPVDLAPRDLVRPISSRGGLSIADAPGRNHCLECGDCVRACEWIIAKKGKAPVPLRLGFHGPPAEAKEHHGFSTFNGRA
jgi:ferredoxin-type protein NapH